MKGSRGVLLRGLVVVSLHSQEGGGSFWNEKGLLEGLEPSGSRVLRRVGPS